MGSVLSKPKVKPPKRGPGPVTIRWVDERREPITISPDRFERRPAGPVFRLLRFKDAFGVPPVWGTCPPSGTDSAYVPHTLKLLRLAQFI